MFRAHLHVLQRDVAIGVIKFKFSYMVANPSIQGSGPDLVLGARLPLTKYGLSSKLNYLARETS